MAGFTLIEAVIAISILSLVGLISSSFLLTTLSSSSKVEVSKEVRQNGDYALSVMKGLILSADSVTCQDSENIRVQDVNGGITTFTCDETTAYKISSASAAGSVDLTGSNVAVTNCNFTCTAIAGGPTNVGIGFTVSQKTSGSLTPRPNERSSQNFQSEVMMRNF